MKKLLINFCCFLCSLLGIVTATIAQPVTLNADGPGNTYELINSVLAPGYDVVETPDCVHTSFGRHIAEVFDATLNKFVFEFYSHVTPDNDRCIVFDRQRVEIKTYDQSPAYLIGTLGETITYRWRFLIPAGFQPSSSFTHIHQIKPVGGDDGNPLFTLTPRKGTPNKLELIHDNTNKVKIVDLSLFAGNWVEATEVINVGPHGTYSMSIKRLSDNAIILSYSNNDILTIRPDNNFIRPKWGIYRSLANPGDLRDEGMRFSDFYISEGVVLPVKLVSFKASVSGKMIKLNWNTSNELNSKKFDIERSSNGAEYSAIGFVQSSNNGAVINSYQYVDSMPLAGKNYYRLKMVDANSGFNYSKVELVDFKMSKDNGLRIYPNPVKDKIQININDTRDLLTARIINAIGENVFNGKGTLESIGKDIENRLAGIMPGIYFLKIFIEKDEYTCQFLKIQ